MWLKPGEPLSNGEDRHGSGVPDGAHYKGSAGLFILGLRSHAGPGLVTARQ